jgi:DNA-binding NarL/FixJ family response regulator
MGTDGNRHIIYPAGHDNALGEEMTDKSSLTSREIEILRLMSLGYLNKQIATSFNTSEQTVKNYISRIFIKLGAANRVEAVIKAAKLGIVRLGKD